MLPYTVREGLAGFRRARFATFTSTSAMAVALVLIGLFGMLTYQGQQVAAWLRTRVGEVELFLDEDVEEANAQALYERAQFTLGVDEAQYITRERAVEIFLEEFGEEGRIFADEAFLPPSIKVRVEPAYANPDSLSMLVEQFAGWNRVDEVVFNQDLLVKVQRNLRLFGTVGLALGALVVLAALFLVANTIRLTIYARRLLIRTMKLVGATDDFIRRPFVVEGVVQGAVAGLAATGLIAGLYGLLLATVPGLYRPPLGLSLLLALGLVVLGMLLGWLGSALAARRFIKDVALH